ncbi:MAG TPA: STAS domain-containing protein [Candidatus Angelobacter sp.]|jgi:anti-anti-sigma factor|nr:STAS domain-containing protein [Candidatus Angelobacter sp.]
MLNLKVHHLGEVAVFECSGRITAEDSCTLRNAVLAQGDGRMVVLDLKEVNVIDAAGLGVLVSLRNWAQNSGKQLKLMNLMPRVERVMEITRLRSVFEICSAREMLDLWCRAIHAGMCSASAPYNLAAASF